MTLDDPWESNVIARVPIGGKQEMRANRSCEDGSRRLQGCKKGQETRNTGGSERLFTLGFQGKETEARSSFTRNEACQHVDCRLRTSRTIGECTVVLL